LPGGAVADKADLIAVIYDAIMDPSRWDEVVRCIIGGTKYFSGFPPETGKSLTA
jgi:hypothetical protein